MHLQITKKFKNTLCTRNKKGILLNLSFGWTIEINYVRSNKPGFITNFYFKNKKSSTVKFWWDHYFSVLSTFSSMEIILLTSSLTLCTQRIDVQWQTKIRTNTLERFFSRRKKQHLPSLSISIILEHIVVKYFYLINLGSFFSSSTAEKFDHCYWISITRMHGIRVYWQV